MVGRKGANSACHITASSTGPSLSTVVTQILNGNLNECILVIQGWSNGIGSAGSFVSIPTCWDLRVGNAVWERCAHLKKSSEITPEVRAIERVYGYLALEFSKESEFFLDRLKVLGVCNKFLIGVHKFDVRGITDSVMRSILKHSTTAKKNFGEELKLVFNNFYAVLWNHFRDNHDTLPSKESLQIVKQSLCWIALQGLDHFHLISHKLQQVNFLLAKSCEFPDVDEFVNEFLMDFISVSKEAISYSSRKEDETKSRSKSKSVQKPESTTSEFYSFVSISFVIARLLTNCTKFTKSLAYSDAIVKLGTLRFHVGAVDIWSKALTVYVKCSSFIVWSSIPEDSKIEYTSFENMIGVWNPDSYFQLGDELREIRKATCTPEFENEYPGYNFVLIYSLMESIGGTKAFYAVKLLTIRKGLPLAVFSNFVRETYALAEVFKKLKTFKRYDRNKLLADVTETKIWDTQVLYLFQVFRIICDRIGDKELEIDGVIETVSEMCYSSLIALANEAEVVEMKKISELHSRLSQYCVNLGFSYQKRKKYEVALRWTNRAVDVYSLWEASPTRIDFKVNTLSMTLLVAECLRHLNKGEEGLRWLTKWLLVDPSRMNSMSVPYDVYEQIPWSDWNTHWIQLYKDLCCMDEGFSKSVVDFIEEEDPDSLDQEFTSKALRFEMNSYFYGRQVVATGMVTVGEALMERSICPWDNVLGYLARAIGYWWGCPDEVDFAVELMEEATAFIQEESFFREEKNLDSTAFLTALVLIWRGLSVMKSGQFFVEAEMEILKQQLMTENPEKYKDRDTGEERGVSGFSCLNLDYEKKWTTFLIQGTEILFRFSENKKVLKEFTEEYCPSLVFLSCRLAAVLLSAVGVSIHAVKAWNVLNKLASIYDKKGLMVLTASEILKVIPDLEMDIVVMAEKANRYCNEKKLVKHNRAICYRLSLAKAIACFNNKAFGEGVGHLVDVLKFVEEKDNFDSTHHVLGEASYVISLYRGVQFSHQVDLSALPTSLSLMSPVGLATKGYKLLCGLTREVDVHTSGWTDLFHNYYLVGSIMNIGSYTMKLLKECGKTRELKCFTNDAVQLAQHCGFITWSISLVVPLIEIDIEARNFKQAQMKIDVIYQVLKTSICPEDLEVEDPENYQKLVDNLKLQNLSITRLESVSDLKWSLRGVDLPSFYYRNRSAKTVSTLTKDLREGFEKQEFFVPFLVRHHLSCACYICIHPFILPIVFDFLHVQARFLSCMTKYKHAMAVLETSKLYHERAIFRHIYNLSVITMPLSAIGPKLGATKAVQHIYTPFCVQPGLSAISTQMLICPSTDLKMILTGMKKALQILDTLDPKDYIGKSFPVEIGCGAIYQHFVATTGDIKIQGSEIRELLREKEEMLEKENRKGRTSPPPSCDEDQLMIPPPVYPKGIMKKRVPTYASWDNNKNEEEYATEYVQDCKLPRLPIPNFDEIDLESEDTSSSESATAISSSSSVSGGLFKTKSLSVSSGHSGTKSKAALPPIAPPASNSNQRTLRSNVTERRRRI